MINSSEELNYKIELILTENLYKKKVITEDVYKNVNEKLLKLIEICKNNKINNSS